MPTTTELREKRAKLVHDARAILDKAEKEDRDLLAEEREQYDRILSEVSALKGRIDRQERIDAEEADLERPQGRLTRPPQPGAGNRYGDDGASQDAYSFQVELYDCGRKVARRFAFAPHTPAHLRHQPEFRDAFGGWLRHGQMQAALQTDSDTAGGYLTVPEQFVAELIRDVDDMVFMRQLARTFTTTAQSLGAPKRTSKFSAFGWGSELSDAEDNADSSLKFGKRSLTPHYMTGSILISRDLLRAAIMDPEALVREEMARDAGELEEQAFMVGSGAQQPLGVFTASDDGISTARDVSSGNTTTAIGADNLREVKYSLKQQYRADPTLRWLFHRDAVKQISKLKDGTGQYLWQTGITAGDPDRILNIPLIESEWVPNTFTAGKYVGILGAFRYYWIVDALFMDMQRLVETYAKTNQVQFIARRKVDGAPQVEEAFARVKLA